MFKLRILSERTPRKTVDAKVKAVPVTRTNYNMWGSRSAKLIAPQPPATAASSGAARGFWAPAPVSAKVVTLRRPGPRRVRIATAAV